MKCEQCKKRIDTYRYFCDFCTVNIQDWIDAEAKENNYEYGRKVAFDVSLVVAIEWATNKYQNMSKDGLWLHNERMDKRPSRKPK